MFCCYKMIIDKMKLCNLLYSLFLQPVSAILMDRYLRTAIRKPDSASAGKMWSDGSVTSAW